ncbi:hypothetical protein ACWCRB_38475, partial [Streptomyces sp. NPDC002156]
ACSSRCSATAPSTNTEPPASLDERHRGTPPPHRAEEALAAVKEIVAREADLDAEVEALRKRVA